MRVADGNTDPLAHMAVRFDFYGLTVEVCSPAAELCEAVRRDFTHFEASPGAVHLQVEMQRGRPPYETLPAMRASLISPRNVCYREGARKYVDYFGRGLAIVDDATARCTIHSEDDDLLHEIAYLYLLSSVGEHLDAMGWHRLHALGVSHGGAGFLLLLPSGGGKSTMALQLVRQPGFLLLSEDTPLVDRRGDVHPFPLRLGVRPGEAADVPPQFVRTVTRMEFDPKSLIDLDYVRDRIGRTVPPAAVLVGERSTGEAAEITPLSRTAAFGAVFKNMVVGLGVYQGIEFVLEHGLGELVGKSGVALSRSWAGARLLRRAAAFRFVLGRDREANTRCFIDFVERAAEARRDRG
jgi:hypothetical protein